MRRLILALAAGALLVPAAAAANPPNQFGQGNGAFIDNQVFCQALPDITGGPTLSTDSALSVTTPTREQLLSCHFDGPPPPAPVNISGFPCATFHGYSTDSRFVYTSSGQATLTCRIQF